MIHLPTLLAQQIKPKGSFLSVEFLVTVGLLIGVLLAGAVVLYFVDAWRKKQTQTGRDSTESLTSFRAMYERGELTEEEYQKVRNRVARQMKAEVARPSMPTIENPSPAIGEENNGPAGETPTPSTDGN